MNHEQFQKVFFERFKQSLTKTYEQVVAELFPAGDLPGTVAPDIREHAAALLRELDDLVGESGGVFGLHQNGDPSPWDELLPGGRFERLSSTQALREALDAQAERPQVIGEIRHDPHGGWYVQWLVDVAALPKPVKLYTGTPTHAEQAEEIAGLIALLEHRQEKANG